MTEFLSCRTNLEVDDLAPAAAFLRDVLGFQVEVDEPDMGLLLLRRDAVGLALVRSATPGVNATTSAYIGVTGVDDLHQQCAAHGARIVTGLADHPWGLRDFVVEMPGGHRLALGERIAPPRLPSSPDLESADALGRFGLRADVLHHGGARPVARPLHQEADFVGRSLEDRLDAAVRKVPHPAAHAVPFRHLAARAAEEHALHPARDQYPVANHTDTVRPDRRRLPRCGSATRR